MLVNTDKRQQCLTTDVKYMLNIVDQPDPWSATSISPVGAEIEGMQGGEGRKSPVEYFGPEGVVGE